MSKIKEEVRAVLHENVGWIIFDAPGANILTRTAFERIAEILEEYERKLVKAVVFSGARGNFCGGLRLKYMQSLQGSPETANDTVDYFYEVGRMIREFPTSTIVAIEDGVCFGLAIEIAALCDYVVALEKNALTIKLGALAIRYGFMLGLAASWRLAQKIGVPNTARFLLNSEIMDLSTAKNIGIVDALLPGGNFREAVEEFAQAVLEGEIPKSLPTFAPKTAQLSGKEIKDFANACGFEYAVSQTLEAVVSIARTENFREALAADKAYFKKLFFSAAAIKGIEDFLRER
jgi:enoyl-CoA hydratase/carnithine racemase